MNGFFRSCRSIHSVIERLENRVQFDVTISSIDPVNVSRMPGDQAEPAIAIDPLNPAVMFAASNNDGSSLVGAFSTDGGHDWTTRTFATGADGLPKACCDPSVAFDSFGNLFLGYLGEDSNHAELLLSTDGGASFQHVASLGKNADQPTVAAGQRGSVWVAFQQSGSATRDDDRQAAPGSFARSQVNRNAASKVATISAGAVAYGAPVTGLGQVGKFRKPLALAGTAGQNVGDIVVGLGGQVMVAYQTHVTAGSSSIVIRRDPKGLGGKFLKPQLIGQTNVSDFFPIPAQARRTIDASVGLAYDRSSGPYSGRLYMVYTDAAVAGSADTDIFLRFSDDDGQTWSAPIRVNDDSTSNSQFFPRIAVDPASGAVGISWYDCRNDTGIPPAGADNVANNDVQVYAAVGTPTSNGVAFRPNFAVTSSFSNTSIHADANDFGDYSGLAFVAGELTPAWADNSNSTGDNPDGVDGGLDLYMANVAAQVPAPPPRTILAQFGDVGSDRLTVQTTTGKATLALKHGIGMAFLNGANLDLSLRGTDARSTLSISGPVTLGNVSIAGAFKSISAHRATLTGTLSIAGPIASAIVGSITGGAFAAAGNVGTITLNSLSDAKLLAGANLGSDQQPGGTGDAADSFSPASIKSVKVATTATASFIAAGVDPVDGIFGNDNDLPAGGIAGSIRSLIFRRGADAATVIEAGTFVTVRIPGKVNPALDQRFRIV